MSNKLTLNKVRAKNFRSIGNMFIELDYQANLTTLIASENNGSGKSTLSVWALFFALFGKAYKKGAKIASLVNSKSNKDCLVELEFETLGAKWMVRRGYKPAIFEIYKDGKLIDNEAANKDMQAYLQAIIGMDDAAFSNIVALGVDRFVPFVEMKPDQRREFVEQMLDMVVISHMNTKAKEKMKAVKAKVSQVDYDIGMLESKLAGRQRTLGILIDKRDRRLAETGGALQGQELEEAKLRGMIDATILKINEWESQIDNEATTKLNNINVMNMRFKSKIEEFNRNTTNITSLTDCPQCKQCVTESHKNSILSVNQESIDKLAEPMQRLYEEKEKYAAIIAKNEVIRENIKKASDIKHNLEIKLSGVQSTIKSIKATMVDSNEESLIQVENTEIVLIQEAIEVKVKELAELAKTEIHHTQLLQVLKDDGIKASIVSQYLPYLNQSINNILDQMNLYVQINIDSEFNVSMFSPDRKGQTLENLSTGQIRRVDLACMLSWRNIAKNKSSVDCNVLILDEILENLSSSGVEEFMEMWQTIGADTNLMVISQRELEFSQYFDNLLKYKLVNDMTVEV